ncbi:MAG: tRNA uridine-5-carboxymethylaminomethyl(34) synthesis enzyme MnmG [Elusimicrobia bacterium]|nr:tRNA uridine-5-carboxymethylaminomethyl(34) synthesis enzyme MnmG [Elusimicrobiota bacterium]
MTDLIVIGAGHAAIEAALAGARLGHSTLLITLDKTKIGQMSCNPAVGGVGKGQVVREIDALGGEMARATDRAGLQFKMLNRGKGPAVWSPRVQCDRTLYRDVMTRTVLNQPNLTVLEDEAVSVLVEGGRVTGVRAARAGNIRARAVVIGAGTFMKGLMHRGFATTPGGRIDEQPASHLSDCLRALGFEVGRLKTGTPPRLDGRTIDYTKCVLTPGDEPPVPMSHFTTSLSQQQLPCWLTHTTEKSHEAIRNNLDRSPLYTGRIKGVGPRYCPSIEDKVVKFPHHNTHQVFIEPEGYITDEVYVNGLSTSLPEDVQEKIVRAVPGLENARFIRYGYAVEYDFCPPTQLKSSLETKSVDGLFLAGQVNGTTGYEEAAGQGILAGINAIHFLRGEAPLILRRDEAYIGVMIDDLVTKGADEPYRLMTSRAEYRLHLRWDNADLRLMDHGRRVGLLSTRMYDHFLGYRGRLWEAAREALPADAESRYFEDLPLPAPTDRGEPVVPHGTDHNPWSRGTEQRQVEIERLYWGYMKRERAEIAKFRRLESRRIPFDLDYNVVHGMLLEARQKCSRIRPESLGQAARIPGVTPADAGVLMVHLERRRRERSAEVV